MPREGEATENEGGAWRSEPRPLGGGGTRQTRNSRAHRAVPPAPHVAGLEAPAVVFWRVYSGCHAVGLPQPGGVAMDKRTGPVLPAGELPRRGY